MKYPLQPLIIPLPLGQQTILVPDMASIKDFYARGMLPAFPYWANIWPAAVALAVYLQQQPQCIRDKNVLELAAGLGLPSLVAARFASNVLCTDIDEDAMDIATRSVNLNGISNMQCRVIDWNEIPENLQADVLLLSDVNYEPAAFETLHRVLQDFIQKGTRVILATPQRLMAKPFIEDLLPWCRHRHVITAAVPGGQSTDISILILGT